MENIEIDMKETLITLTSDIVAAHVANNGVPVEDVPVLIKSVYSALSSNLITSCAWKTARNSRCSSAI